MGLSLGRIGHVVAMVLRACACPQDRATHLGHGRGAERHLRVGQGATTFCGVIEARQAGGPSACKR